MKLDVTREINHREYRRRETTQDRPNTSGSCPNRYVFEHLGNPSGGTSTIQLYGTYKGVALAADMNAVIDWDATDAEVTTALETANGYTADPLDGFPVTVSNGPLVFNAVTITLPAGVRLRVITDSLTPSTAYPHSASCCGV